MSTKKYIKGSIQIVDGTQGAGKLLTSDVNGLSTWGFSVPIIDITRDNLYLGLTSSTLKKDANYYITDRKIWLKALDVNLISNSGQRKMTIVKDDAYHAIGTLGVWNDTLLPSIGDKVIWGGKLWINTTGVVGSYDDDVTMNSTDWTLITSDTLYYDKIFYIEYDLFNDSIKLQSDNFGNIVRSIVISSVSTIDFTDWGNALIKNNSTYGIYNNHGDIQIYENENCFRIVENKAGSIIYRNLNTAGILLNSSIVSHNIGNRIYDIINNSGSITGNCNLMYGNISSNSSTVEYNSNTGVISGNTTGIINNSNIGGVTNNSNTGGVSNNSNNGAISTNSNIGGVSRNSNNGSIINNSNDGEIVNNSNLGDIDSNSCTSLSNNGHIDNNSNASYIYNNSNNGAISYNNNNGQIVENSNNGQIVSNSNNGNISGNTQTSGTCDIGYNNNNGEISGARTTDVIGTVVNL